MPHGAALFLPLLLATATPPAAAPQQSPSGAAAQVAPQTLAEPEPLRAWREMVNSGDPARMAAFMRDRMSGEQFPVPVLLGFRRMSGGVSLVRMEEAGAETATAILEETGWPGFYLRASFKLDRQTGRITELDLRRTDPPAGVAAPARTTQAAALATLSRKLLELSDPQDAGAFSGAVLVAKAGKPVFQFAGGLADREAGIRNGIETKFRVGSMNKMMTSVAILKLAAAGRIKLDAPVSTYLPRYANQRLAAKVTARQLLTHTGAVGDIFGPDFPTYRTGLCSTDAYLKIGETRDVAYPPGDHFAYSNYGFILLGAIVESVTGKSYYDYVRQVIFKPAKMTGSGFEPETTTVPGRAAAYTFSGDASPTLVPAADTLPCRGSSAGGGYATVGDLARFGAALEAGSIIDAASLAMATRPVSGDYGLGFQQRMINGARSYGHGGGAPGMSAVLLEFPESGYSVAVASNVDGGLVGHIAEFVGARLPLDGGK